MMETFLPGFNKVCVNNLSPLTQEMPALAKYVSIVPKMTRVINDLLLFPIPSPILSSKYIIPVFKV